VTISFWSVENGWVSPRKPVCISLKSTPASMVDVLHFCSPQKARRREDEGEQFSFDIFFDPLHVGGGAEGKIN